MSDFETRYQVWVQGKMVEEFIGQNAKGRAYRFAVEQNGNYEVFVELVEIHCIRWFPGKML